MFAEKPLNTTPLLSPISMIIGTWNKGVIYLVPQKDINYDALFESLAVLFFSLTVLFCEYREKTQCSSFCK